MSEYRGFFFFFCILSPALRGSTEHIHIAISMRTVLGYLVVQDTRMFILKVRIGIFVSLCSGHIC